MTLSSLFANKEIIADNPYAVYFLKKLKNKLNEVDFTEACRYTATMLRLTREPYDLPELTEEFLKKVKRESSPTNPYTIPATLTDLWCSELAHRVLTGVCHSLGQCKAVLMYATLPPMVDYLGHLYKQRWDDSERVMNNLLQRAQAGPETIGSLYCILKNTLSTCAQDERSPIQLSLLNGDVDATLGRPIFVKAIVEMLEEGEEYTNMAEGYLTRCTQEQRPLGRSNGGALPVTRAQEIPTRQQGSQFVTFLLLDKKSKSKGGEAPKASDFGSLAHLSIRVASEAYGDILPLLEVPTVRSINLDLHLDSQLVQNFQLRSSHGFQLLTGLTLTFDRTGLFEPVLGVKGATDMLRTILETSFPNVTCFSLDVDFEKEPSLKAETLELFDQPQKIKKRFPNLDAVTLKGGRFLFGDMFLWRWLTLYTKQGETRGISLHLVFRAAPKPNLTKEDLQTWNNGFFATRMFVENLRLEYRFELGYIAADTKKRAKLDSLLACVPRANQVHFGIINMTDYDVQKTDHMSQGDQVLTTLERTQAQDAIVGPLWEGMAYFGLNRYWPRRWPKLALKHLRVYFRLNMVRTGSWEGAYCQCFACDRHLGVNEEIKYHTDQLWIAGKVFKIVHVVTTTHGHARSGPCVHTPWLRRQTDRPMAGQAHRTGERASLDAGANQPLARYQRPDSLQWVLVGSMIVGQRPPDRRRPFLIVCVVFFFLLLVGCDYVWLDVAEHCGGGGKKVRRNDRFRHHHRVRRRELVFVFLIVMTVFTWTTGLRNGWWLFFPPGHERNRTLFPCTACCSVFGRI